MRTYDTVHRNPLKQSVKKLTEAFGFRLLRKNKVWFDYAAYPPEPEANRLSSYLEQLKAHESYVVLEKTPFSEKFVAEAKRKFPTKTFHGFIGVGAIQKNNQKASAWVLGDNDNGYNLYKAMRDGGVPAERIIYNSLFSKSPWQINDFHSELKKRLEAMPPTMNDDARLLFLSECVRHAAKLEGDLLEIGTYKGGTAFVMLETLALAKAHRNVHLIDWYQGQSSGLTLETVRQTFSKFPNANVIDGRAEEVVPAMESKPLSFVHMDINADQSVIENVLPHLYRRLVPGGMMLFDNYYFRYFSKYNLDRFAESVGEHIMLMPSISQGLLIKSIAR